MDVPSQSYTPSRPASGCADHLRTALLILLTLLVCISCSVDGLLVLGFLRVRRPALEVINETLTLLDTLEREGFRYEYRLKRTIPFEGDIPIQQSMTVPFQGTIPIDTTVQVPIDTPLGRITLTVPIQTEVQVNTTVPVDIDQTFHVKTEVPVDITVPIVIDLRQTPFWPVLERWRGRLRTAQRLLSW